MVLPLFGALFGQHIAPLVRNLHTETLRQRRTFYFLSRVHYVNIFDWFGIGFYKSDYGGRCRTPHPPPPRPDGTRIMPVLRGLREEKMHSNDLFVLASIFILY